jgi:pyrroloquinoline quinone biosynthesis protein B
MRVKILGSGAGGAFPQWNCGCSNCRRLRSGTFHGSARSQAQVAVSGDGDAWFLLNASPDLRYQIEATPELHPRDAGRNSPVRGVMLSGADLDLCLGLLLLREWHSLQVYSTAGVHAAITGGNRFFSTLERMPGQVNWHEVDQGVEHPMRFSLLPLGGNYPSWVASSTEWPAEQAVSAIRIETASHKLAYLPGLPRVTPQLVETLSACDVLLIDGTFWSEDELIQVEPNARRASEIGHLPMSGPGGTLEALSDLRDVRRIYIHINNTNPALDESGPEYRAIREAGWELAFDGMEIGL